MSDKSKIQTTEQEFRKMLKEEKMVVDLEMAVKKVQFKITQDPKQGLYDVPEHNFCYYKILTLNQGFPPPD